MFFSFTHIVSKNRLSGLIFAFTMKSSHHQFIRFSFKTQIVALKPNSNNPIYNKTPTFLMTIETKTFALVGGLNWQLKSKVECMKGDTGASLFSLLQRQNNLLAIEILQLFSQNSRFMEEFDKKRTKTIDLLASTKEFDYWFENEKRTSILLYLVTILS